MFKMQLGPGGVDLWVNEDTRFSHLFGFMFKRL